MSDVREETRDLLCRMSAGDADAGAELYEMLYRDLHARARGVAGAPRPGHSLQATALIGEAWLRPFGPLHRRSCAISDQAEADCRLDSAGGGVAEAAD